MTILVVEDDPDSVDIIREALEADHYAMEIVGSGKDALEALRRNKHIQLILLDRMLPGMSGLEFLQIARRENLCEKIPVILQSAHGQQEAVIEGASQSVYYYLVKPYSVSHLLAVVRAALTEYGYLDATGS